MPHIHTQPGQHDLTSSAYIVRLDGPEPVILLHMHKLLGTYLQFGGHVELHENPWQTVAHEINEESGYRLSQLQLLQPELRLASLTHAINHPLPISIQTHKFGKLDHYHTDIAYAFVTSQAPQDAIGEGESGHIVAFTAEGLKALSDTEIFESVRETALFVLRELLPVWQRVPADGHEV